MPHHNHQGSPIKSLLVLNLLSSIFSLSLVITLIALDNAGFGKTYSSSSTCNIYLSTKYETQKQSGFASRFVLSVIALLCLLGDAVSNIRSFMRIKEIQQLKTPQIFHWEQKELVFKYLCESIAVIGLLPPMVFYLSAMVEEGGCWKSVSATWIVLFIEGLIALAFTIAAWVILVKFAISRPSEMERKYETNIQLRQLRQKEMEIKNLFDMEGSELYRTLKRDNKDSKEPLLYQNTPIPLHPAHNQHPEAERQRKLSMEMRHYGIPQQYNVPAQTQRKKSIPAQALAPPAQAKRRFSALIQQKKHKFKEINPMKSLKKQRTVDENEWVEDFDKDIENRVKNLPKSYAEYIKQAKKPKRQPPNTQAILEAYQQQENAKEMQKKAEQEKPFLKKYRKQKQESKQKRKETEDEIEFIEENILSPIKADTPNPNADNDDNESQSSPTNEPELFFHKPRNQKNLKKKRKSLFAEEVAIDSNKQENNQVIINKTKEAKNNKIKNSPKIESDGMKSPKRKSVPQSKEDIMLKFLRSKYSATNQAAVPEQA